LGCPWIGLWGRTFAKEIEGLRANEGLADRTIFDIRIKEKTMSDEQNNLKPEKKDNQFSLWLAIGIAIGAGLGVALHNIPVGVAVGLVLGISVGTALSQKNKK
jgi:zinc transporter ZupT